ncbi:RNA polymerase sigma factor [Mucilaginibacter paludis]|uniref:RNA polymerase sigma-70 region 2 domain-containing protein n=1 Tax=Mucilaginibacter paludis DSM 18603 TaxID=714943 RepID=H1Y595_9SPHI|nr:sigma factor [Mucilaginibacter paludis]EHQ28906.1 hypothetical protein Mucpa_4821 [Mucilaginibacter paludis DSM 18603]
MNRIYENLSDPELLNLLGQEKQAAFLCIYKRYWSELYRCAFKIAPNQKNCEEVIHDVFLLLWNERELTNINSLKDYLYIALKNSILNRRDSKINLLKTPNSKPLPASFETEAEEHFSYPELNEIHDRDLERSAGMIPADDEQKKVTLG